MANIMRLGGGSGGGTQYVWNKCAFKPRGGLPVGYTEVEYIQSSGTQKIDMGVSVPHSTARVVVEFSPVDNRTDNVLTGHAAPSWSWATNLSFVLDNRIWVANTGVGVANIATGTFYTFDYTSAIASVNGAAVSLNSNSFTDGYNDTLFYSSTKYGAHRVKHYQLYNGSVIVRDLVSCINASGEVGMYDRANGVFRGNSGTGKFIAGPPAIVGQVRSTNINAYPNNGWQDGYYYVVAGEETTITENGSYDVRPYAIANVNVQSAPVLLWTNASPTSAFGAQTVNVASGYDAYLIECRAGIYNAAASIVYIPAESNNAVVASMYKGSYGPFGYSRYVTTTATGSITFSVGRSLRDDTNTYNDSGIPTRIWGVKFTL